MRVSGLVVALALALPLTGCGEQRTADVHLGDPAPGEGTQESTQDGTAGIAIGEPVPGESGPGDAGEEPTDDGPGDGPREPCDRPTGKSEPGHNPTTATAVPAPSTTAPTPDDAARDGYTEARPGQADVRAREWESAEVQPDDVTVVVTWWSGVEPCSVLDRVEVREEPARVVITLFEGHDPESDGACPAMAVEKRTRARLTAPLAGRPLVDGAGEKR
jgi:hypothetical protein